MTNGVVVYPSTSGGSPLRMPPRDIVLVLSAALLGAGTSTAPGLPADLVSRAQYPASQTTPGASLAATERPGAAVGELRRLSGLTWDQLARLFGVSRRSLHFWASGKVMSATHEEQLQRVLGVFRKVDRGSANANRAAMLAVRDDGTIPFDLLLDGKYERVVALIGGAGVERPTSPKLAPEVLAARAPRRPSELVDALNDRVHREVGVSRAATSVKVRSGA